MALLLAAPATNCPRGVRISDGESEGRLSDCSPETPSVAIGMCISVGCGISGRSAKKDCSCVPLTFVALLAALSVDVDFDSFLLGELTSLFTSPKILFQMPLLGVLSVSDEPSGFENSSISAGVARLTELGVSVAASVDFCWLSDISVDAASPRADASGTEVSSASSSLVDTEGSVWCSETAAGGLVSSRAAARSMR